MKNKKLLITGGLGYIGSHLVEKLRHKNNVFVLDNLFTGSKLNQFPDVTTVVADVDNISDIFSDEIFDFIFHLGEYSRVEQSFSEPELIDRYNVRPFRGVIQFALSQGSKLVYAGSSTRYYNNDTGYNLSPYSLAKFQNIQTLMQYQNWYGLNATIVYFFNTYGGRELDYGRYATVIGKFKNMYLSRVDKFPVNGSGLQRRNFTHIDDAIRGLLLAAEFGSGDGYNLGNNTSHSILDVCRYFDKQADVSGVIDVANRLDSNVELEKMRLLGWSSQIDLESHIKEWIIKHR